MGTAGTAGAARTTGGGAGLQSGAACTSRGHLKEIVLMLAWSGCSRYGFVRGGTKHTVDVNDQTTLRFPLGRWSAA